MDLDRILNELYEERQLLTEVIESLEAMLESRQPRREGRKRRGGRRSKRQAESSTEAEARESDLASSRK